MKTFVRWVARGLAILFTAFISLFALDVFDTGSFGHVLVALLIHLIPTFLLIAALLIAWRQPLIGGGIFFALALAGMFWLRGASAWILALLPALIGSLFILDGWGNRKKGWISFSR